ncbi:MAG: poly-beta-1,6-N-acetyl-D-glucosamine synthase [Clostridiales bacterium]
MSYFIFYYPLFMSITWIIGSIIFHFTIEKKTLSNNLSQFITIIVPCYNEENTIEKTIFELDKLDYENYEIIAINDGSKDNTETILNNLSKTYKRLRVIQLQKNAGKANALYLGLLASVSEIIVCVDADAYLDKNALDYLVPHFEDKMVGAVTGNPRVRNRSNILSKIQLCEFSSIIGQIKRTQSILGRIMTVSGVVVAFRKRALLDCGFWDRDIITEDIGVTWKLQRNLWNVKFEPRAICWMLVPETLKGLWEQRLRWAQGGLEVLIRHWNIIFDFRQKRLILILLEQVSSVIWAFSWAITMIILIGDFIVLGKGINFLQAVYLVIIALIQFFIAMLIDSKYDNKLKNYYIWSLWYPVIYWYMNAIIIIFALPKALFSKKGTFAVWESPDRGLN